VVDGFLPKTSWERVNVANPYPHRRFETIREAMDAVLEAERDAQAALAGIHKQADEIVAGARETARNIQARTQNRITRMHTACETRTADQVTAMKRKAVEALGSANRSHEGSAAIQQAVLRLAERMTTPHGGDA
jgi:vacuolar-type H+-ATPase subunit H